MSDKGETRVVIACGSTECPTCGRSTTVLIGPCDGCDESFARTGKFLRRVRRSDGECVVTCRRPCPYCGTGPCVLTELRETTAGMDGPSLSRWLNDRFPPMPAPARKPRDVFTSDPRCVICGREKDWTRAECRACTDQLEREPWPGYDDDRSAW